GLAELLAFTPSLRFGPSKLPPKFMTRDSTLGRCIVERDEGLAEMLTLYTIPTLRT
ncbi:3935_t:CDS:1, partial [Cetraspora pellucida]